jgi:hypothetical protein
LPCPSLRTSIPLSINAIGRRRFGIDVNQAAEKSLMQRLQLDPKKLPAFSAK